jgi:hypothetical protein
VTLVRTGEAGMGGLSVLLLERTMPGITSRRIKTQVRYASFLVAIDSFSSL